MPEGFDTYGSAASDFFHARRKAALEMLLARFRGKSSDLLSYEEVRQKLRATSSTERGLHEVPIDAIVGSVGRYTDFTRSFLPKQDTDKSRWVRVKVASSGMVGLPPIEVYKIGDVYFVKDGNHRVSIAREVGAKTIQAYVTEVHTSVPITPDIQPDDLIVKAEYAEFLDRTHFDRLCPGADLSVTAPGQYAVLEEHISVHRYYMGLDLHREVSLEEAVVHWYEEVYLPIVHIIRNRRLLHEFPDRTETDLYLWLSDHREVVKAALGWDVDPESVADDLVGRFSARLTRVIARVGQTLSDVLMPNPLESGPPPGLWREKQLARARESCLFHDILVPLDGRESGWRALDQAAQIAKREGGQLYGLYVTRGGGHKEIKRAMDVEKEFERRCAKIGVNGSLALEAGRVAPTIIARARWADLLAVSLNHPPGTGLVAKLQSGFRMLVQQSPVPVLALPSPLFPLERVLLAYDGSPKSQEALFVTTYLAERWPGLALAVLAVEDETPATLQALAEAEAYLGEHGLQATFLHDKGEAGEVIVRTAGAQNSDLIVMGSYTHNALLEVILGSAVNRVLREWRRPVLICR